VRPNSKHGNVVTPVETGTCPGSQRVEASMGWGMRKINRAVQLTLSDWRYLATASVELFEARYRFATNSPKRILQGLQEQSSPSPREHLGHPATIDVERVSWAVTLAAHYVPWRSDCLIQVMAADRWLRRHGVCADFHLGVAKDVDGGLKAHAWLRYGNLTVTGGRYDEFAPLIEPPAN